MKLFWTKSVDTYVNGSLIINCQFISVKIKQNQFFLLGLKPPAKLRISFQDHLIKKYNCVKYLGCFLDYNLNGETIARKVFNKINGKLKCLYRQATFLNPTCKRLLCTVLIHPHFDYGCISWYPLLSKVFKKRFQITQNECIRYCLDLPLLSDISTTHFRKINWLPVELRVELCTETIVFKYWNQLTPSFFNEILTSSLNRYNTRLEMALDIPLWKTVLGNKSISFLGPKILSKMNNDLKTVLTTNYLTHTLKKEMLNTLII